MLNVHYIITVWTGSLQNVHYRVNRVIPDHAWTLILTLNNPNPKPIHKP